MSENKGKNILALTMMNDGTANIEMNGNFEDIVEALIGGVDLTLRQLVDDSDNDSPEEMFNDIKNMIVESIADYVNYENNVNEQIEE